MGATPSTLPAPTVRFRVRRLLRAALPALALLVPPLGAHAALPRAASVPGGIALLPLGPAHAGQPAPRAWLGEQPVLVTAEKQRWIAVVGLALDLPPGAHELRVSAADGERRLAFEVRDKRYPEQRITLRDGSKVQLSPADEARATREIAAIGRLKRHWRETADPSETDAGFALPAHGRMAGRFGLRRFFNGEARAPHAGFDIAVPRGTPVVATSGGSVLATGDYFFNGKTVFVDHGNGLITMYCHLDRIDAQPGAAIAKGQRLGLAGSTGRATGPHLHWSVVLNGAMVDPELFLPEAPRGKAAAGAKPPRPAAAR